MNLLDFFFPKRCVGCGRIGRYFCLDCQTTVRLVAFNESMCPVCEKPAIDGFTHPKCKTSYSPDGLTSFFHYDGIVKKAVKTIKYRFVSDLADEFVSLIPTSSFYQVTKQLSNPTLPAGRQVIIIPIPIHPTRLRERGFNQAALLGSLVASKLYISMRTDILKRVRKTTPQVEMRKRKERLENMKNVFAIIPDALTHGPASPAGGRMDTVLLFDDVFTTGATMRAAANILKRAGVKRVWAVTMAR